MRPKGAVNLSTWVFLLAVGAGIYALVMFAPVYFDHIKVKEAVEVGLSNPDTEENITKRVADYVNGGPNAVGTHFEENPEGGVIEVPGLGLTADNIVVERDDVKHVVRITVDYERRVRLIPTDNVRIVKFHIVKEGAI